MNDFSRKRIAILVHGFAGKTEFMEEIETNLKKEPFTNVYDSVFNLSYYSSPNGLDFSKKYDLRTPIFSETTRQTLAHHLYNIISEKIKNYEEGLSLDFYAHSMGGIVTRSMLLYLAKKDQDNNVYINNAFARNVFLLGTPNHGTRLAQRMFNIPADMILTGLNFVLELPHGIKQEDLQLFQSQFIQMNPKSNFLKKLNADSNKRISRSINWITVRGLNSSGLLGIVWQPFLFQKFWISNKFPFLHTGTIPNDGLVDASSVPLKYAINLTIPEATHMDLLKWNTKNAGKKVEKSIQSLILKG